MTEEMDEAPAPPPQPEPEPEPRRTEPDGVYADAESALVAERLEALGYIE
jgi:hypothetical protein